MWGVTLIALSTISCTFAYTQEQQEAYQWAYKNKITTQSSIQSAKLNWIVTRQVLSKMLVNYLENVAGVKWAQVNFCSFTDENKITNDLKYYTKKICAYKIMWSNNSIFRPTQPVSRAQLWTALSRVLWWEEYNSEGKWYYIYHLNALKHNWIMDNIKNSKVSATRWEVLIALKKMSEKFGSNIYLNWNSIPAYDTTKNKSNNKTTANKTGSNMSWDKTKNDENEYISNLYSNSNVIYTWKDGTKYYYDDKFLTLLKNTAEKKWESDLAKYLEIEAEYYKNGLDQLSNMDDEEMLKMMWIDTNDIDPDNMTEKEKKQLIKKFRTWFGKIIEENKDKNSKVLEKLKKVTKNISNDKFWLKKKYQETKAFMESSNSFLDFYAETMFSLIETALSDNETNNSEEWTAKALWLIAAALAYQSKAEAYQIYVENWATDTIKLFGWTLLN